MKNIVLASTSKYRRALLDTIGLEYSARSPHFDELPVPGLNARETALLFAKKKAESLAAELPDALIIGADQTVEIDGRILGKPGSKERAVEQLMSLSGRTHRLNTAVALCDAARGTTDQRVMVHQMKMRSLSRSDFEGYVERDQPIDCAGAYKIEALGIALFEEMRGVDHTAIVGLPITLVIDLLARAGFDLLRSSLRTFNV